MKVFTVLVWYLYVALSREIFVNTANSGSVAHTDEHQHSNNTKSVTEKCGSKDIRNSVENFDQLRGCRVIEGYLIITLINQFDGINDLELPELTEVRDFVLLYRVDGLKSLDKLFPNLRVIRGNYLLDEYALIVYEMSHLQEIGLKSLMKITSGSVRIERNPLLYVDPAMNWSHIVSEGSKTIFKNNEMIDEHQTDEDTGITLRSCSSACGERTCNSLGECCEEKCTSCADDDPEKCLSCRFLTLGYGENLHCVEKCPHDMYVLENLRCVTAHECRNTRAPLYISTFHSFIKKSCIEREDDECALECVNNHCEYRKHVRKSLCPTETRPNSNKGNEDPISRYSTTSCTQLSVNITNIGDDEVAMEIETLQCDDYRKLLGYIVHYIPSLFQNATMNQGGNSWTSEFLQDDYQNTRRISHILTDLTPNTQYAFYVQTFQVSSEEFCGLSSIQYFTTELHSELQPTTKSKAPRDRNYDKNALDKMASEVEESIEFEDFLQNVVYLKRIN